MSDQETDQPLTRARLRELQSLNTAKGRREQGLFLLDGEKMVFEALAASAPITQLLSTMPEIWLGYGVPITEISQADAERLSDTTTPQGHFAVVEDRLGDMTLPNSGEWQIVALDVVQDPGNVGGIIRSAAAFGAAAVIVGPGSADPTHPRVTRAATGAWFRVPIVRSKDLRDSLSSLQAKGSVVFAADTWGHTLHEANIPSKAVWVFGNEGAGIGAELEPYLDERVAIPITPEVDSLNVSVAAGIILHHARQRVQ